MDYSMYSDKLGNATEHLNLTVSETLRLSGWETEAAVIFAQFRKQSLPDRGQAFFDHTITSMGNCLTFNHTIHQTTPGAGNGLKLALMIDQDGYYDTWIDQDVNDHKGLVLSAGLKIYIYSA